MELLKISLVSIVILLVSSCSTAKEIGFWMNSYTKSVSFWQCVEPFTPHKNKEC